MRKVLLYNSTTFANYLIAAVLTLVPFHAFLTVWAATLLGHYTLIRLWDELLLTVVLVLICVWVLRGKPLRHVLARSLLVRLIGLYAGLTLLLGLVAYLKGDVTVKALGYGAVVNLRYLLWLVAVMVVAQRSSWLKTHWRPLLLVPAALVVLFGALQYTVLPHNFLSHFGYSAATNIAPIETINHNSHYIRVQSTLRGANPLGAYLVVVASAVSVMLVSQKRWRLAYSALGAGLLLVLYASGSRSAWIGTALAVAVVVWLRLPSRRSRTIFTVVSLAVLVALAGLFVAFRSNTGLVNALLHTQQHSAVATSSNSAHASALRNGITDVVRQPFGAGPGTAGPASAYNGSHPARIAENYFVQIAQETGWLGLGLLLAIFGVVARELYRRARLTPLALALFASFLGLCFVSLLSHNWVDDTLAYLWWGMAGIVLAPMISGEDEI